MRRLPVVAINGLDHYADLRLREFRAVDDPHHRITFAQVDTDPDSYRFDDPIALRRSIIFTRNTQGNLQVAVEGEPVRRFADYPLGTRVEARLRFFYAGTDEEHEKLDAAHQLPPGQRALVKDDILCARAAAVHAEFVSEDERIALEHYAYEQDPNKGFLDKKLRTLTRKRRKEPSL